MTVIHSFCMWWYSKKYPFLSLLCVCVCGVCVCGGCVCVCVCVCVCGVCVECGATDPMEASRGMVAVELKWKMLAMNWSVILWGFEYAGYELVSDIVGL